MDSAPVKDGAALNLVFGVNHGHHDPAAHGRIKAARCKTNGLAPVVKVIHEGPGIKQGAIPTVPDVTTTGPASTARPNIYGVRGRHS